MKVPQFKHIIGVVSTYALDLIVTELERFDNYTYISVENCGCFLRKSHGLPCAHELRFYFINGESIPPDEIDVFWRTLEIHKSNRFTNVKSWTGNVCEPLIRKETRGRPSFKSKKMPVVVPPQESRRHSTSSYTPVLIDLNAEVPVEDEWKSCSSRFNFDFPNQHEPFMPDFFMEPTSSTYPFTFQEPYSFNFQEPYPNSLAKTFYMDQIPFVFRSFIREINDVRGDGNCGFRSVAVALGRNEDEWPSIRQELYEELMSGKYNDIFCDDFEVIRRSIAENFRWMIMPDTGFLIVERYKCIVNFISINESSTCFSLFTPPPRYPIYPEMTILHVNGNHFVNVQMEENHPMGAVGHLWKNYKHPYAAGWDVLYEHRLNLYSQNTHVDTVHVDLSTP